MAKAIRRNNTGKKAVSFILGFFSCILLVIGSVAGLGIWAWYGVTLNKLEDSFGFNTPLIQDNGAIKDQTLGQIIQTIMGYTDLSDKTLKDVKDDFSLDIPSTIEGENNYSKDLDGLLEKLRLEDIVGIGDVISDAMEQPEFLAALVTGRHNPLATIFEYFTLDDIEGLTGQELPQYGLLKNGDMNLAEVLIAVSGATNMDTLSVEYIEDTLLEGDYIRYLTGILSLLDDIRDMSVNEILAGLEDGTLLNRIKVGTILDGANELLSEIVDGKQLEEGDEVIINQTFIENYRELSVQDVIDDPLAMADVSLGDLVRLAEKAIGTEKTAAVTARIDCLNLRALIDDPVNTLEQSGFTLGDLLEIVNVFTGEVDAEGNISNGVIPDSVVTIFDEFNIGAVLNGKFNEEMQHLVVNDFMRAINDMAGSDVITDAVLDLFTQNGAELTVYDLIKEGGFESFYRAVTVEQLLDVVNSYSDDMIDKSMFQGILQVTVGQIVDDPMSSLDFEAVPFFKGLDSLIAGTEYYDEVYIKSEVLELFKKEDGTSYTFGEIVKDFKSFGFGIRVSDLLATVEAYAGDIFVEPVEELVKDWTVGDLLEADTYLDIYVYELLASVEAYVGDIFAEPVENIVKDWTVGDLLKTDTYLEIRVADLLATVEAYAGDIFAEPVENIVKDWTVGDLLETDTYLEIRVSDLLATVEAYAGDIFAEPVENIVKDWTVGDLLKTDTYLGIRVSDLLATVEAYAGDIFVEPVEELVKDWTVGDLLEADTYLDIYVYELLDIAEWYLPGGTITEELYVYLGDYQLRAFTDIDEFGRISLGELFAVINAYSSEPLFDLSGLTSSIRTYTEQLTIADIADDPNRVILPVLGVAVTFIFEDTVPYQINAIFDGYDYALYHIDPLWSLLETKVKDAAGFVLEIVAHYVDNPALFESAEAFVSELFGDAAIYEAMDDVLDTLKVGNILGTLNIVLDQTVISQELKDALDFTLRELIDDPKSALYSVTIGDIVNVINSYTEYVAPDAGHILFPLDKLEVGIRNDIATTSIDEIVDSPLNAVLPLWGVVSAYIFEGEIPTTVNEMFASVDYENYHADPAAELMNLQPAHIVLFINEVVYRYTGSAVSDEALAILAVVFDGVTLDDCSDLDSFLSALRIYNFMQAANLIAGTEIFNDGWLKAFYTVSVYDMIYSGVDVLLALDLGNFIEIFNEYELGDIVLSGLPEEFVAYIEELSVNEIVNEPARLILPAYLMAAGYLFKEDMPESVLGVCDDIVLSGYHQDPVGGIYFVKVADLVNSIFDALRKYDIADIDGADDLFYDEENDEWIRVVDMFSVDTYKNMKIKEFFELNGIPEKYYDAVELLVGDSTVGDCVSGEVLNVITVGNILRSVNIIAEKQVHSETLCEIFDKFTIRGVIDDPMNLLELKVAPLLTAVNESINAEKATIAPGIIELFGDYTIKEIIDDPMGFLRSIEVRHAVDAFNFYAPEKLDLKLEMYTMMSTLTVGKIMDYPTYIAPLALAIAGNYLYEQDPPQSYVDLINEFDAEANPTDEVLNIRVLNLIDVINDTYEQFAGESRARAVDTFPIKNSVKDLFTETDTLRVFTQKDFYFNVDLSKVVVIFYDYVTSLEFNQELYDLLDGVTVQSLTEGAYKDFLITDIIKAIDNLIPAEIPYLDPVLSFVENWTVGGVMDGSCLKEVQVKAVFDLINAISPDLIKTELYDVFGTTTVWGLIQREDLDLIYLDKILTAINAYTNGVIPTDFVEMFPHSIQDVIDDPMVLTEVKICDILDAINNVINKEKQTITQETIDVFGSATVRDVINEKLEYVYDLKVADLIAAITSYIPSMDFDADMLEDFGMGGLTVRDLKDDPVQLGILGAGAAMYVVFGKIPDSVMDIYEEIKDEENMLEAALDLPVTRLFDVVNECYRIKSGKTDDIVKVEVYKVFVTPEGTELSFRDMTKVDSYLDLQLNNLIDAVEAYVSAVSEYVKPEVKTLLEGWRIRDIYSVSKWKSVELSEVFDIVNSYKSDLIKSEVYTALGSKTVGDMMEVETYKQLPVNDLLPIVNAYAGKEIITDEITAVFDGWVVSDLWNAKKWESVELNKLFAIANNYKDGLIKSTITDLFDGWVVSDLWSVSKWKSVEVSKLFAIANSYREGLIKQEVYDVFGKSTIGGLIGKDDLDQIYLDKILTAINAYTNGVIPTDFVEMFPHSIQDVIDDPMVLTEVKICDILDAINNVINKEKQTITQETIDVFGSATVRDVINEKLEYVYDLKVADLIAAITSYIPSMDFDADMLEDFGMGGLTVRDLKDDPVQLGILGAGAAMYVVFGKIPDSVMDIYEEIKDEENMLEAALDLPVTRLFDVVNECYRIKSGKTDDIVKVEVYKVFVTPEGTELSFRDMTKVDSYLDLQLNNLIDAVEAYVSAVSEYVKPEVKTLLEGWRIRDIYSVEQWKSIVMEEVFDIVNAYTSDTTDSAEPVVYAVLGAAGDENRLIKSEVYTAFGSKTVGDMVKVETYKQLPVNDLLPIVNAYAGKEIITDKITVVFDGWVVSDLWSVSKWKSVELSKGFDIVNSYKSGLIKSEVYTAFGSKTVGDMVKVETYKQLPVNDLLPIVNAYAGKEIITDEITAVFDGWVVSDLWSVAKWKSVELSKGFDIVNSYKSGLIKSEVYTAFGSKTVGDMVKVETYKQLPVNDLLPIVNAYAGKEIITDKITVVFDGWVVSDLWNVAKWKSVELSKGFDVVNSYKSGLIKTGIYEAIGDNTIGDMLKLDTYKSIKLNSLLNVVYDYTKFKENELITEFLGAVTFGDLAKAETYDLFLLGDALEIVNSYKNVIPAEVIDIVAEITFRDFAHPKTLLAKIEVVPVLEFVNGKLKLGFDSDKMDTAFGTLTFYDFFFKVHTTCKKINLTDALDLLIGRWFPEEVIKTFTENSVYDLYTTPKAVLGKIAVADVFKFSFIPTNIQSGMEIALCDIKVSDCIEYNTLAGKLYLSRIAEGLDKAIGGKYVIASDELIALCRDYTVYDLYKNYKQIAQETKLTEVVGVINSYFKNVEMDISNVDYIKDLTVYDLIEKPQYLVAVGIYGGLYFWYNGEIPAVYFDLANEFADGGVWSVTVKSTFDVGEELFRKISGKDQDLIKEEVYTLFKDRTLETLKSKESWKALEISAIADAINAYKANLIRSELVDVFKFADETSMTVGDLLTSETRNQIAVNKIFKAVESYAKKDYIKESVYTLFEGVTLETLIKADTYLDMMVWDIYKVAEEYIVGSKTDGVYGRIKSEAFRSALNDLIGDWTVRSLKYKNTYREIELNTLFELINIAFDTDKIKPEVCTLFKNWTFETLKNKESWKALEISAIADAINAYKANLIRSELVDVFKFADETSMTVGDLLTSETRNQIAVNKIFKAVESYAKKDYIKESVYTLFEGVTLETLVKADTYLDMMVWDIYKVAEEYIVGSKTDGVYGRIKSEAFRSALNDLIGAWKVRDLKSKDTYSNISVSNLFKMVNASLDKNVFKQSVIDLFKEWALKDFANTSKLKEFEVNSVYAVLADYKSSMPAVIGDYLFNEQAKVAFDKLFEGKKLVDLKDKEFYKSMLVNDVFALINGVMSPKFEAFLGEAFFELGKATDEEARALMISELFTKDGLLDLELGTLADAVLQMMANFGAEYSLGSDITSMLDGVTIREFISNKMNLVAIGGAVVLLVYFNGELPPCVTNFIGKLDLSASDVKAVFTDITVEDTVELIKGFGYYPSFLPLDVYDVIRPCRLVGIIENPMDELSMLTLSDIAQFNFLPVTIRDILDGENLGKVTLAEIKQDKAEAFKYVTVGEITDSITALPELLQDVIRNMNLGNCFKENGLVNEVKAVKLADFIKAGGYFDKLGSELIDYLTDVDRALTIGDLIDSPMASLGDISLKTLFSLVGTFDESLLNALEDVTLAEFKDKGFEAFYDIKIGSLFDLGDDAIGKMVAGMTIGDIRDGKLSEKRIGEFLDAIESIDPETGAVTYKEGTSDTVKAIGHLTLTEIQDGALDNIKIAVFLGVGTVNADETVTYAEGTSPFIKAIGHLTLGNITEGDNLKNAINTIALKDIFTGDDLPQVLKALFYEEDGTPVTLNTLADRVNHLTLKDVFGEQSERSGVLSALDDDVLIDDLMSELTKAMFGSKSQDITVTASLAAGEYLVADLDATTKAALAEAFELDADTFTNTYYKVSVKSVSGASVTLTATTKATIKISDIMAGSGEDVSSIPEWTIQELIYKLNQQPTLGGSAIPDYDSWWDVIAAA